MITLAGESLPLSVEMLGSLEQVATLFEGRALVEIRPTDPADVMIPSGEGSWSGPQPVPQFLMRVLSIVDEIEHEGEAEPQRRAS